MTNSWLALEPVQVLQSLIAEPATMVAGRPFLVRGYRRFEDRSSDLKASLHVSVWSLDDQGNQKELVDQTSNPIIASIDRSAVDYLSQSELSNSKYMSLCRNILDHSYNWFVRPENFVRELGDLNLEEKYFLEFSASTGADVKFDYSSFQKNKLQETLSYFNSNDSEPPGENFGEFYITADPGLSVNVIGLRYHDTQSDNGFPTVQEHQFERANSYLKASFPVGTISWTKLNMNAPAQFAPPFTSGHHSGIDYRLHSRINTANAFIAALRANDIAIGVTPDTLYYGMINAEGNDFEGAASDVPLLPSHNAVATGPADNTTGYYCAHELAHMLGLTHPGGENQKAENYQDWLARPHRASNERRDDLLLRMDSENNFRKRLPWKDTVDLMSYGDQTWPSFDSYLKLHTRLVALNKLTSRYRAYTSRALTTGVIFVSGTYDLNSNQGHLQHVLPLAHYPTFDTDMGSDEKTVNNTPISDSENGDLLPQIAVSVASAVNGKIIEIKQSELYLRRDTLDFPHHTGMFMAVIPVKKINEEIADVVPGSKYFLTLQRVTRVIKVTDSSENQSDKVETNQSQSDMIETNQIQLDQTELALVSDAKDAPYGRIRPVELDLRATEDRTGYYLRIDRQLHSYELLDCSFIVEEHVNANNLSSVNSNCWRTVALNTRAGEDVYLDASIKRNAIPPQAGDKVTATVLSGIESLLNKSDSALKKQLNITDDTENGSQRVSEVKQNLKTLEMKLSDAFDCFRAYSTRVRIVATRGLDKVTVFDGLLVESAIVEDRIVYISADRQYVSQGCVEVDGNLTLEQLEKENEVVEKALDNCRKIFLLVEKVFDLESIAIKDFGIADMIVLVGGISDMNIRIIDPYNGQLSFDESSGTSGSTDTKTTRHTIYFSLN